MNLQDRADALTLINLVEAEKSVTDRILEIRNEEAVRNNMYTNHEIRPEEHQRWISGLKEATSQQFYAVLYQGEVAGGVGISSINTTHRRADWAFYLSDRYQGQGLGSALEAKFLQHVFARGDIDKLNCEVISWNEAVVKLHKKFGFREEGTRRNHVVRDGQSFDAIFLGITRDEWVASLSGAPYN